MFRTWNTGDQVTASHFSSSMTQVATTNVTPACVDDYSSALSEMQTTANPYISGVESLATSTAGELERLRYVIQQTLGWSQWYTGSQNINLGGIGVTRGGVQGAGLGAHLTAVGLHVGTGWHTAGSGFLTMPLYPSIASVADHRTGLAFPVAGHIAVVIRDGNVNGGVKGGIEVIRIHAQAMTLHHTAAIRFWHSEGMMDGGQRGHVTALQVTRGLVFHGATYFGQDEIIVGHVGSALRIATSHVTLSHAGGYIQLVRHIGAMGPGVDVATDPRANWHLTAHIAANAMYADTIIKAAVDFDGSNTQRTVSYAFNVASVARNAVGDYTVTFSLPFLTAHFAVAGFSVSTGGATGQRTRIVGSGSIPGASAGLTSVRVSSESDAGTNFDCLYCTLLVVGPQQ